MKLVKLNAIDSTNNFLKNLVKDASTENWTVITAEGQTAGKGQFQNKWYSEPGKNLTFSVLCEIKNFKAEQAFYLNCLVSLGIFKVLQRYIPHKLNIKWPNDILSHSKKLCGILIENTVSSTTVVHSVIGVGLNVNQDVFDIGLPSATSMKLIARKEFDRKILLQEIVRELKIHVKLIEKGSFEAIKNNYEKYLFRINMPSMYKDTRGYQFMGKIQGINDQGNLLIELENGSIKSYGLKEIQFI